MSGIHVSYYTDPASAESWGLEPVLRRLAVELGDQLIVEPVMAGLAREFGPLGYRVDVRTVQVHHLSDLRLIKAALDTLADLTPFERAIFVADLTRIYQNPGPYEVPPPWFR